MTTSRPRRASIFRRPSQIRRAVDVWMSAQPQREVDPAPLHSEITALSGRHRAEQPANDTAPAPRRPHPLELGCLLVALVAFVAFNMIVTLDLQPVWLDEVSVADPAVNLYLDRGFHSSAWQYQPKEQFWASNAPLHQILLFHWLKAFALSARSVRSLNFVLMAVSVLMTWLAVVRLSLVNTWQGRFALIAMLTCTAGLTFNYAAGRYDCIGILLCVTLLFAFSIRSEWARWLTLLATSIFVPIAGVALLPYVLVLSGLCLVTCGRRYRRELATIWVGIALGAAFLYMLYATNLVAHVIVVSAGGHALHDVVAAGSMVRSGDAEHKVLYTLLHLPGMLGRRIRGMITWYTGDPSFILLALFVVGAALYAWRRRRLVRASLTLFAAAAALAIPFVLGLARNYPFYYSWMSLLPLAIASAALLSELIERRAPFWQPLAASGVILWACYWGMPQRLREMNASGQKPGAYQRVDAFLAANAKPDDRAYADFEGYYGLIARTRYTLLPTYRDMLSETEKSELSLLVVRRENARDVQDLVGGHWQRIAALAEPIPYDLLVYRRLAL
jgi:hypothetical protein